MWVFMRNGFFSATESPLDPSEIQMRFRSMVHLQSFKKEFGYWLSTTKPLTTEHTDYPFRLIVSKATFSQIMVKMADDIDYSNFKSEVAEEKAMKPKPLQNYLGLLHEIWQLCYAKLHGEK